MEGELLHPKDARGRVRDTPAALNQGTSALKELGRLAGGYEPTSGAIERADWRFHHDLHRRCPEIF
jgi:hypothetical protein